MAETALFSVASKLLSTIVSPAIEKAYEKGQSIWNAKDELAKLKRTIETIHVVLLDAEKKQESSAAVKDWMKRVKEVLYDADDLFDKVVTDDMLKQQKKEGNDKLSLIEKVRVSCFNFNPIISRNSIAKHVKDIRNRLHEISNDMEGFGFMSCGNKEEIPYGLSKGQDPGCFVNENEVIGRDKDKEAVLKMLFNESNNAKPDVPVVISVVGIGGMGKTTFVQLIYNVEEVKKNFENRWFACISDTTEDKEVIGKIFQSICEKDYDRIAMSQLETKIRESIKDKKFLLILDDVWDVDHARWQKRLSLLGGAAKGSEIIVTTRSPEVARALDSLETHNLDGLSEDKSWSLFKMVAFTREQENDPIRTNLGREIVKKCRNVPLAIRSIGSLLFEKNTILEWESFKDEELHKIKEEGGNSIMDTLKLSYDHLPSNLKQCFAYCSLFPKDDRLYVKNLIYLWIAQGYIKLNLKLQRIEEAGQSCFMYLLRRGFFQEAKVDRFGEIVSCKMHDLIHDLALCMAGEESIMLASTSSNTSNCTRHVSIGGFQIDESWSIPTPLLNVKGLRSCLLMGQDSICSATLYDQVFANFKLLRALNLSWLGIKDVPRAIGELKHLRYLDISENKFETLPDSMTNLVNLVTLDISECEELKALPDKLRKLINLRYLNISNCYKLMHMPGGMGEMNCLQYLSHFIVGKAASEVEEGVKKRSGLDELARLQHQLRGKLEILFEYGIEEEEEVWDGDECRWQLPVSPHELVIDNYPGMRIADWGINIIGGTNNNLSSLKVRGCRKLKYLPPLRCLPNLRILSLHELVELEYVEEEENECIRNNANNSIVFPHLEELELFTLRKLKGWWRKEASTSSTAPPQFPLLSKLRIEDCGELELKSFSQCTHLRELDLKNVDNNWEVMQQELPSTVSSSVCVSGPASTSPPLFQGQALTSLQTLHIYDCNSLKSLHLASLNLKYVRIRDCNELLSLELPVEAPTTSVWLLVIRDCKQLKNLHIAAAQLKALNHLNIGDCPELKLWESPDKRTCHLDWDSCTNLRQLRLRPLPTLEKLPHCLQQRQALGQLEITSELAN